jgi:pyruvate dehydrogenase E2 component (dihydrolipoamide acetyltransferase)
MAISVVMPALEMAQETGKLISWLKKEGDAIAKGEPLLEVETDKAVMEIESPGEGILAGVKVQAGAEVAVGKVIAWVLRPGEALPMEDIAATSGRKNTSISAATPVAATQLPTTTQIPEQVSSQAGSQSTAQSVRISPKARRIANDHGVSLAEVTGSGPGGEILASDVLAAAEIRSSALTSPVAESGSLISRLMAERTTQSWTTVPHFFLVRDVDAGALNDARKKLGPKIEKIYGLKLTHSDLLIALVACTLRKSPRLNASWTGAGVHLNTDINVGLAMAVEDGVVAPVLLHVDKTVIGEIAAQRRDLTDRARSGKLRPADVTGGTFTISNLGMFGVDAFTAIIVPPQAAILAVGAILDRVVPVGTGSDVRPGIRPMMTLTLSSDHRVVDGARAAEFMRDLVAAIGNPEASLNLSGVVD